MKRRDFIAGAGAIVASPVLAQTTAPTAAPAPAGPARYTPADLDAVLEDWDEVLDVSRDDLDDLFRAVEARVIGRG